MIYIYSHCESCIIIFSSSDNGTRSSVQDNNVEQAVLVHPGHMAYDSESAAVHVLLHLHDDPLRHGSGSSNQVLQPTGLHCRQFNREHSVRYDSGQNIIVRAEPRNDDGISEYHPA